MTSLLVIGNIVFESLNQPFKELTHEVSYRWDEKPIIGGTSRLQFTGKNSNLITIKGTVATRLGENALGSIERLKNLANTGKPQTVLNSSGENQGLYAILKISETRKSFDKNGVPREIDFTMEIKRYEVE